MTRTASRDGDLERAEDLERAIAARIATMHGLTKREIAHAAADIAAVVSRSHPGESGVSRARSPSVTSGVSHGKGREMNIVDVRARMPKDPEGNAPSDWTLRRVMAEVGKFRIGKWDYVYESDLEAWLGSRLED